MVKQEIDKAENVAVMSVGSRGPSGALGTAVVVQKQEIDDVVIFIRMKQKEKTQQKHMML